MKKLICVFVFSLVLAGSVWAQGGALEVRGLYFHPVDKRFQDVYSSGAVFGVEGILGLGKHVDLWISGDYFRKKGELIYSKKETTVRIIPIAAGLRWRFSQDAYQFYISAGAGYFLFQEENIMGTVNASKIGYLGKAGYSLKIIRGFYLNAHLQYAHCSIQPLEIQTHIGGLSLGIGIGYDFGLGEKEEKWIWREIRGRGEDWQKNHL
ncbi:MAG: hypothetical protein GF421_07730 [Candidatus Aminicenantes bacterium]|nr:hypothetical protein [Candidatus Aminicenantes bacterium]